MAHPNEVKRVRVVTGYAAHARFMMELGEAPAGSIPRRPEIPSPYAYSPVHTVWDWYREDGQRRVFIVETKHRRYEVFEVVSGPIEQEAR